ncbi:MAG: hypothetical protein DPW15_01235 [Chloroflexi bacterium]|nr:hypothetical protein [Chloroflexota bacterium]
MVGQSGGRVVGVVWLLDYLTNWLLDYLTNWLLAYSTDSTQTNALFLRNRSRSLPRPSGLRPRRLQV